MHRSVRSQNRGSWLVLLVHPVALATGASWTHGRATTGCREPARRGNCTQHLTTGVQNMKSAMTKTTMPARIEAAGRVLVQSCSPRASPTSPKTSFMSLSKGPARKGSGWHVSGSWGERCGYGKEALGCWFGCKGSQERASRVRGMPAPSCG